MDENRYYRPGPVRDLMGAELEVGDAVSFMSADRYHKKLLVGIIKEVSKTEFSIGEDFNIEKDVYFLKIMTTDKKMHSTRNKECAKIDQEEFTLYKLRNK